MPRQGLEIVSKGYKGLFVTLEGGEGTGKSTQMILLQDFLESQGVTTVLTREPGGTEVAEKIRRVLFEAHHEDSDPLFEALLLFAARRDHLRQVIWPALAAGKWVLCDRYTDSTRVYQGTCRGLENDHIRALDHMVAEHSHPDLTFILDCPVEKSLARLGKRHQQQGQQKEFYDKMDQDFHQKIRESFLAIAAHYPERCRIVNGDQEAEAVSKEILRHLRTFL